MGPDWSVLSYESNSKSFLAFYDLIELKDAHWARNGVN